MPTIQIEERRYDAVRPSIQGTGAIFGRRAFSWGGVWAGALSAIALQLLCGLAVDARLYLLGGQAPVAGISVFAGVWYLIYMAGSMWLAGVIAGQTGGAPGNRLLHSFIAWSLATVLGFNALAVWGSQSVITVTNLSSDVGSQGIISPGWMLGGLLVGLMAALYGSFHADEVDPSN